MMALEEERRGPSKRRKGALKATMIRVWGLSHEASSSKVGWWLM